MVIVFVVAVLVNMKNRKINDNVNNVGKSGGGSGAPSGAIVTV